MDGALIDRVVDELCDEGEGLIYPPYLQIVGYTIYATLLRASESIGWIPLALYEAKLHDVRRIISNYFSNLLGAYKHEQGTVARVLRQMVTDHQTKKRVRLEDLQRGLPDCRNVESVLRRLVDDRIVRRNLGEFELIHDCLAQQIIDVDTTARYLPLPVRNAVAFIDEQHADPKLSAARVARAVEVTRPHLSALFGQHLGESIKRKINRTRISKAKELLGRAEGSLGDVARRTGFPRASAFSRTFRELEGISPTEYRNAMRGAGNGRRSTDTRRPRARRRGEAEEHTAPGPADAAAFQVLVSYNKQDERDARAVVDGLKQRGVSVWFAEEQLAPGEDWQQRVHEAIGRVPAVAVLIGPRGIGRFQDLELRACVQRSAESRSRLIPVLLPGLPSSFSMPRFLDGVTHVDLRSGLTRRGLDKIVWGIENSSRAA